MRETTQPLSINLCLLMCAQVYTVSANQWSYEYQNYFKYIDMDLFKIADCMNKRIAATLCGDT